MKHSGYYTRALQAADKRYQRVFEKLGYGRRDMEVAVPESEPEVDVLAELRAEYEDLIGRRPFMGWDAETLAARIAAAKAQADV